jgi:hypothetical protein
MVGLCLFGATHVIFMVMVVGLGSIEKYGCLVLLIGISSCLQVSQADSVLWKCLADQAPTTVCVFKPRIEDRESTLLALSTSRKKISKNIADSCVTTIARFLSPDSVSLIMM